jgi:uncharacterized glyoxalase superfamily protein PhnB
MPKGKPIPDGMNTVIPHLTVKDAAKAIEFYKRAFGAKEMSRHAIPSGQIMHASIKIGDSHIFLNDEFPQMGSVSPQSVGGTSVVLTLYVDDVDTFFKRAVDAGAQSKMPVADQFWGDRYGLLQDPFGHQWAIATHKEDLSPEEMERRGKEAMAQMSGQK